MTGGSSSSSSTTSAAPQRRLKRRIITGGPEDEFPATTAAPVHGPSSIANTNAATAPAPARTATAAETAVSTTTSTTTAEQQEEEEEEQRERLPLESEALLRQLVYQLQGSLQHSRREIGRIRQQCQQQQREAAAAAERQEAVLAVWGTLQTNLLLLQARISSRIDRPRLHALLRRPGRGRSSRGREERRREEKHHLKQQVDVCRSKKKIATAFLSQLPEKLRREATEKDTSAKTATAAAERERDAAVTIDERETTTAAARTDDGEAGATDNKGGNSHNLSHNNNNSSSNSSKERCGEGIGAGMPSGNEDIFSFSEETSDSYFDDDDDDDEEKKEEEEEEKNVSSLQQGEEKKTETTQGEECIQKEYTYFYNKKKPHSFSSKRGRRVFEKKLQEESERTQKLLEEIVAAIEAGSYAGDAGVTQQQLQIQQHQLHSSSSSRGNSSSCCNRQSSSSGSSSTGRSSNSSRDSDSNSSSSSSSKCCQSSSSSPTFHNLDRSNSNSNSSSWGDGGDEKSSNSRSMNSIRSTRGECDDKELLFGHVEIEEREKKQERKQRGEDIDMGSVSSVSKRDGKGEKLLSEEERMQESEGLLQEQQKKNEERGIEEEEEEEEERREGVDAQQTGLWSASQHLREEGREKKCEMIEGYLPHSVLLKIGEVCISQEEDKEEISKQSGELQRREERDICVEEKKNICEEKEWIDMLQHASLLRLRRRLGVYRHRAHTAEKLVEEKCQEIAGLKVDIDRLNKQATLLRYRMQVRGGAEPAALLFEAASTAITKLRTHHHPSNIAAAVAAAATAAAQLVAEQDALTTAATLLKEESSGEATADKGEKARDNHTSHTLSTPIALSSSSTTSTTATTTLTNTTTKRMQSSSSSSSSSSSLSSCSAGDGGNTRHHAAVNKEEVGRHVPGRVIPAGGSSNKEREIARARAARITSGREKIKKEEQEEEEEEEGEFDNKSSITVLRVLLSALRGSYTICRGGGQREKETASDGGDITGDSMKRRRRGGGEEEEEDHQRNYTFLTTEEEDESPDLQEAHTKLRKQEMITLQEERDRLQVAAADIQVLKSLQHDIILHSPPYLELQRDAAQLAQALTARTVEVEELRRELLLEQSQKDFHFESLLGSTREQREELLRRIKDLTEEAAALRQERDRIFCEREKLKEEVRALRIWEKEQEVVAGQRCAQLTKLKLQHEQLKNAGAQMLQRNERMRKEKQQLIDALRQREDMLDQLQLRNSSAGRAAGTTAQNILAAATAAGEGVSRAISSNDAAATTEGTVAAKTPVGGTTKVSAGAAGAAGEEKDVTGAECRRGTGTTGRGEEGGEEEIIQVGGEEEKREQQSTDAKKELPAASPASAAGDTAAGVHTPAMTMKEEDEELRVKEEVGKLKRENEALRLKLNDYDELDAEMSVLREQYSRVSEEVDEVSKAFEERHAYCEHLLRQLKEREEALLELRNRSCNFVQQQQMLQRLTHLHKQKLLLLRQQYEQSSSNCRAYAEALQHANTRASLADQQRDELAVCYQQMQNAREHLFKEKEEALSKLSAALDANKALDAVAQESLTKRSAAETALRKARHLTLELERKIEKMKAKEEKLLKRKAAQVAAQEEISSKDVHLLEEENETMRRRLLCSVCTERFKDHIINKCGHMYCYTCLERNVKTRNRKCPHCKAQFDQKDIRRVYLDL